VLFNEIEKNFNPLVRRQTRVILLVGLVGVVEAREDLEHPFHTLFIARFGWQM
jgi:hypothetical protein